MNSGTPTAGTVGDRLRAARVERGLTQEALARGVVTKGFISQVERNQLNPSLPKLRLLADRLGKSLAYFLGEAPQEEPAYLIKAADLAVRAGEPARAQSLIEEALTLPVTANERANLLRIRGLAYYRAGDWSKALGTFYEAAATAPADDPELNASIYVEIGMVLGYREQFSASTEANLRALKWLDQARQDNLDLRARLLTNMANDSYKLGDLQRSIDYLRQALEAATNGENLMRLANAHMAMGITERDAGHIKEAIDHSDRALLIHQRIGQQRIAALVLTNLGDAYFAAGDREKARHYQEQCLQQGRLYNDQVMISAATTELARYALLAGELEEAVRLARDAQASSNAAGDHLYQATGLAIEGSAVERQGRKRTADRLFWEAFRLLLDRDAATKLSEICAMYSQVLQARGDRDRALRFLRMAYERDFRGIEQYLRK